MEYRDVYLTSEKDEIRDELREEIRSLKDEIRHQVSQALNSSGTGSIRVDLNKEAANHCNPYNVERDVRMVARIPLIVIAKWRNELGVDYWNPDHQGKVDELLNSADWRWLRTDGGLV